MTHPQTELPSGLIALGFILAIPAIVWLFDGFHSQRCSEVFEKPALEWHICVERLSSGDPMSEIMRDHEAAQ